MLTAIIIKNLAVIKHIELQFEKGLTALTGETGAGKSILIDALMAVLGGRVSKDIIREGEKSTLIEACFYINGAGVAGDGETAEQLNTDERLNTAERLLEVLDDGMLIISREIFRDGRNTVKINGKLSSTSALREIAPYLISIHSQNDNQILFNPDMHYKFLDAYSTGKQAYDNYVEIYRQYTDVNKKIADEQASGDNDKEKSGYLRYVIDEIETAGIEPDEEDKLKEIKRRLKDYEKTKEKIISASYALYESEESAYNLISAAENAVNNIENLAEAATRLSDIKYEIAELSSKISSSLDEIDSDYKDIDKLENRLNVIYQLKMKYGGSVAALFERYGSAKSELYNIENKESVLAELYKQKAEIDEKIKRTASKLSELRKTASVKLSALIEEQLRDLMMPQAKFEIKLVAGPEYKKYGMEKVEFLFSANAGMAVAPLSKIASGGEISRVNLAIKSVLSGVDPAYSFVFDEIDNGISGRAAQKTGEKIYNLSKNNQILCVTHLPQIAAMADNHILVSKDELFIDVNGGKTSETVTNISVIEAENRAVELARMIGGVTVTELTMKNAVEILTLAEEFKS
jgi:DNA repair protein RecN (Recombination protein N)